MTDYMDCPICGEGHNKIDMQYWIKNMITDDMIARALSAFHNTPFTDKQRMRAALEAAMGGGE